jgi:hypothetical protein
MIMRKTSLTLISLCALSLNATAFFNTDSFSPFGNGTGHTSTAPWSSGSNWNPMSGGTQYAPFNDARNMSRYGARPNPLREYRQNPQFQQNNAMMVMPNQIQPSNWLQETDFSKTLDQIKGSGSKTFFVNELPVNFNEGYQRLQTQSQDIEKSIIGQMHQYSDNTNLTNNIYGKQGYSLSPAAASTPRVDAKK